MTYFQIFIISNQGAILKRFNAGTDCKSASNAMHYLAQACPCIYPLAVKLKLIGTCNGNVVISRYREV